MSQLAHVTQSGTDQDDSAEPTPPKWIRRLGRLADLGSEKDPLKVRQRLLENLDALTETCLLRTRSYATGKGELYTVPDPDLKTALGSQLAGARMLGVDGATETKVDTSDLDALLARAKRALMREHRATVTTEADAPH